MMDAGDYKVQETLKNGLRVTVRAIRPDDRDALVAAFKELEARTVYLRFFGPKKEISPRELKEAVEVDFVRTVALVACLPDGAGEKIIGGGRFVAVGNADPPESAEVAFVVEEDYQGLGIASMTLRHLARIAMDKGIKEFQAEVLEENKAMLAVFGRSGFPMKLEYAEGVAHVTLLLTSKEAVK